MNESINQNLIEELSNWVESPYCNGYHSDYSKYFYALQPKQQVRFLQKVMELHRCGDFQVTRDYLLSLINVDADKKKQIGFNVYIVIKTLCKLWRDRYFLTDRELYEILREVVTKKESIKDSNNKDDKHILDCCAFRCFISEWTGAVDKQFAEEYTKKFRRDAGNCYRIEVQSDLSCHIFFLAGEFKNMASYIKTFFGDSIQYNFSGQYWNLLKESYKDAVKFARLNTCLFVVKDKSYIFYRYEDKRFGCIFKEGELARQKTRDGFWVDVKDKITMDNFYWCFSNKCLGDVDNRCISPHTEYERYTLYDFASILGLTTVITKRNFEYQLAKFYSVLNWFYTEIDHLYCRKCGRILEPRDSRGYSAHLVTQFYCNDCRCEEYQKTYRISHCSKCPNVVDERDAAKCPNGYIICNKCGACCSKDAWERKKNAGLITGNTNVNYHFEQQSFYCPHCGRLLERMDGKDRCMDCKVIRECRQYEYYDKCNLYSLYCPEHKDYIVRLSNFKDFVPKELLDIKREKWANKEWKPYL